MVTVKEQRGSTAWSEQRMRECGDGGGGSTSAGGGGSFRPCRPGRIPSIPAVMAADKEVNVQVSPCGRAAVRPPPRLPTAGRLLPRR